jgi:hypothetical protein
MQLISIYVFQVGCLTTLSVSTIIVFDDGPIDEWVAIGGMGTGRKNRSTWIKTRRSATLTTKRTDMSQDRTREAGD